MKKDTFSATVNEQFEFELKDSTSQLDIVDAGNGKFHIVQNNKAYQVEVVDTDFPNKFVTVKLNGNKYEVKLSDQHDQLIKQLGLTAKNTSKINAIKAPMPGLVLDIAVTIGQKVEKEDGLIILEAMKMENVIKCGGDGIITAIHVEKGVAVDKGQLLIEID